MTLPQAKTKMTNEEFFALVSLPENADKGKSLELVDGSLYPKPSIRPVHALALSQMMGLVMIHIMKAGWGHGFAGGMEYVLEEGYVVKVRQSYISKQRFRGFNHIVDYAPELAVDLWLPGFRVGVQTLKIEALLFHGAKMIWILYPEEKFVREYVPTENGYSLRRWSSNDTLTGGDVIPGLSIPVASIFPLEEDKD